MIMTWRRKGGLRHEAVRLAGDAQHGQSPRSRGRPPDGARKADGDAPKSAKNPFI
jgi:hypothetical protein